MAAQRLVYVVRDGKKATSQVVIYLPTGTTVANAGIENTAFAPILDEMIDGKISSVSLNIPLALPGGLKANPDAASDVEEGARFIFETGTGYNTAIRIPTFKESQILANTRVVDQTNTEVLAFIDYMVNGSGGASAPTDYRGDDISALVSALEAFQRSRRVG